VEERGGRTRRDANHEHFNAFWFGQIKNYKRYFGHIGSEQMHLQILATLPAFQRRGHGTSLCKWSMDRVRKEGLKDLSVMASPMGYELYTWLGFDHVGSFTIQVPGEEEKIVLEAMMYRPKMRNRAMGDCDGPLL
jgi:GNAT superfamily N-acetyltransferase